MVTPKPPSRDCDAAIKVLEQYERLFLKVNAGRPLPAKRVKALDELRDRGVIRIRDVPASIRRVWPGGRFDELTLAEIYELCGKKRGGG